MLKTKEAPATMWCWWASNRGAQRSRRSSQPRQAFTLMEVLLVLAVLVVIGALLLPAMRGPLENQRLRHAADLIHAEWNTARVRAMKSGHMQVFRFQPGGEHYEIRPWISDDDPQNTADATGTPGFGTEAPAQLANPTAKQLPEDVLFYAGDSATDSRSANLEQRIGEGNGWSRPILFYSDGSSSTARVILVNRRDHYIVINLRGLTGIAQVSDILDHQNLPQ